MTAEDRFAALYQRHRVDVERYFYRRDPEGATADQVAEVFLVVWRRLSDVPERALPWIYGAARRVLANDLRGRRRSERLSDRIALHLNEVTADHAEYVSQRLTLARAFDELNEVEQEALRLVAWEELALPAAAAAMACSVPAFAMRLHRARRKLRRSAQQPDPAQPHGVIPVALATTSPIGERP